jgi:hypothetical protein
VLQEGGDVELHCSCNLTLLGSCYVELQCMQQVVILIAIVWTVIIVQFCKW